MNTNDTPAEGTYRVSFRITNEGHYRFLESSKIVKAPSRAKAIAATPGGQGAEVIAWGPEDPEPKAWS